MPSDRDPGPFLQLVAQGPGPVACDPLDSQPGRMGSPQRSGIVELFRIPVHLGASEPKLMGRRPDHPLVITPPLIHLLYRDWCIYNRCRTPNTHRVGIVLGRRRTLCPMDSWGLARNHCSRHCAGRNAQAEHPQKCADVLHAKSRQRLKSRGRKGRTLQKKLLTARIRAKKTGREQHNGLLSVIVIEKEYGH